MLANGPTGFFVLLQPSGVLLLRGELDLATVQDLQDSIDEILVPGQPVILDLAQLTFLATAAIPCLIRTWDASGHPVLLRNSSAAVRRFLALADGQSHAWTFDQDGSAPAPAG
jgi:anti-anti-sigma factor